VTIQSTLIGGADGDELQMRWSGDDADSDELAYSVLYRATSDGEFQSLAINIQSESFKYPTELLAGGDSAMVRVMVTDGLNTNFADSAVFAVPTGSPRVIILSPLADSNVYAGSPVSLEVYAEDPEDGPLLGGSVQWSSDLDGALGSGSPHHASLSVGVHQITVAATDRDGNTTRDDVTLFVSDGAQAPRASAGQDQAVNEGDSVVLDASASFDPDEGDTLSFEWWQLDGTPLVTLSDAATDRASFVAPEVDRDTRLRFQVVVTDEAGHMGTDVVDVIVHNTRFPSLQLASEQVDFGIVDLGGTATLDLTITNSGDETLEITKLQTSRSAFSVDQETLSVAPGSIASVQVTFVAKEDALYEGMLHLESNSIEGVTSSVILAATTPNPTMILDDHSPGGSLILGDATDADSGSTSGPAPDGSSAAPDEGASGGTGENGSSGFSGTGGCSLIRR